MFALADCNNFFVSCERVFRPDLEGRPVIVLSNNDGCAIARSNEAKAIGIKMGDPLFRIRPLIERCGVAVFSGNMSLYGDMSRRIRQTLAQIVPSIEVYSIDEAFLDLRGMDPSGFDDLAREISRRCLRDTGIPVSVGIAPTKTLAKIASHLCKRYPKLQGGCYMHRAEDIEKVLRRFPVEEVWGIGRRFAPRLREMNISTAYDFTRLPEAWIRRHMGAGGLRTWHELQGRASIGFEQSIQAKQSICTSRSFSTEIYDLRELAEQVAKFAAMTAEKLRRQQSLCSQMLVFACTNRFRDDQPQQYGNAAVPFVDPTDSTIEIVRAARQAVAELFVAGCGYKRAGVVATHVVSADMICGSLFDTGQRQRHAKLMRAVDHINRSMGSNSVVVASQGLGQVKMLHEHRSPRYTTRWEELPTATIK